MTTHKKVSVLPIYLVGLVWLGYALIFPLCTPLHYGVCAALSFAAFVLGKAIFPDKIYQTPGPTKEGTPKTEAQTGSKTVDPQVAVLQKERDRAISELRRLNDAIPDKKISAQIDHLEEVTGKIIDHVIAKPDKKPQISRFLDYFLPTTLKLLNAYDRMDSAGVSGENITGTKERVEKIMGTIAAAFEKQLDGLFGADALDIATDISVLETMLAREGLAGQRMEAQTARDAGGTDIKLEL